MPDQVGETVGLGWSELELRWITSLRNKKAPQRAA